MAGRKSHPLQPSGGVFRQVHALTSLRFSHSEIQTVAGTPFESHEYPELRLRQTGRLQLDRHTGNTADGVRVLCAFKRRRRHPRGSADVARTVRHGAGAVGQTGTVFETAGGMIRKPLAPSPYPQFSVHHAQPYFRRCPRSFPYVVGCRPAVHCN